MKQKTEKEVLMIAARRLGVLIEEFNMKNEITISAYYDLMVTFDDDGNIVEFETHP